MLRRQSLPATICILLPLPRFPPCCPHKPLLTLLRSPCSVARSTCEKEQLKALDIYTAAAKRFAGLCQLLKTGVRRHQLFLSAACAQGMWLTKQRQVQDAFSGASIGAHTIYSRTEEATTHLPAGRPAVTTPLA